MKLTLDQVTWGKKNKRYVGTPPESTLTCKSLHTPNFFFVSCAAVGGWDGSLFPATVHLHPLLALATEFSLRREAERHYGASVSVTHREQIQKATHP